MEDTASGLNGVPVSVPLRTKLCSCALGFVTVLSPATVVYHVLETMRNIRTVMLKTVQVDIFLTGACFNPIQPQIQILINFAQ